MAKTVKEQVEALPVTDTLKTASGEESPIAEGWENAATNAGKKTTTGYALITAKTTSGAKRKVGLNLANGYILRIDVGVLPAIGHLLEVEFPGVGGCYVKRTGTATAELALFAGAVFKGFAGIALAVGDRFFVTHEPSKVVRGWHATAAGAVTEVGSIESAAAPTGTVKPQIIFVPGSTAGVEGRFTNFAVGALEPAGSSKTSKAEDTVTPTDSLTKKVGKGLADSVTAGETLTKNVGKAVADAVTASDSWSMELIPAVVPTPVAIPAARVLSEPVDDYLYVRLKTTAGEKFRWGSDEPDASGVPSGIKFSTSAPGGHQDAGCTLSRDPRQSWPDLNLVDEFEIRGRTEPLKRRPFVGEVASFSSELGDTMSIGVSAVGNQVQLADDESFRALYVKLGFERWEEAPLVRREAVAASGASAGKIPVSTGSDGISWDPPAQAISAGEVSEAFMRVPAGIGIKRIAYRGAEKGSWAAFDPATLYAGSQEVVVAESVPLTLDGSVRVANLAAARRFLLLQAYVREAVNPAAGTQRSYSQFAAYGTDIPVREIPGALPGVYAHDALPHMLAHGAPNLTYSVGAQGSIVPNTSFVLPDLAFEDPGTVRAAVEKVNAYFLNNWGVWGHQFFWQPWDPTRLTWKASIAGGAHWAPAGRQADTRLNGIVVLFTDAAGVSRMAGPPESGCDFEHPLLADPDPNNPYTRRGRRRWGVLSVEFPIAYASTGIQIGSVFLEESKTPQRSGTLIVRPKGDGHIPELRHPTMGALPVWSAWAGDYIELDGWPEPEPFRCISTEYDDESKQLTAQLDNGAARLSGMLERVGVRQVGVMTG